MSTSWRPLDPPKGPKGKGTIRINLCEDGDAVSQIEVKHTDAHVA